MSILLHRVPKWPNFEYKQNLNSQLSNAICAQILPTELQDQHQPIYWVHVNGSSTIVRFFEKRLSRYCSLKFGVQISGPSEIQPFTPPIA